MYTIFQLQDLFANFSDYVNEDTPPSVGTVDYNRRLRFFNRGRDDFAKRFWWPQLLKQGTTINITTGNSGPYALANDMAFFNSLDTFKTDSGGINYTDPFEPNGNSLIVTMNPATGTYQVTLNPPPTQNDTVEPWYYYSPQQMVNATDFIIVDGECVLFFSLIQYFFGLGQFTNMQVAQQELENRIGELLKQHTIMMPGQQKGMMNLQVANHQGTNERGFYSGNTNTVLGY